MGIVHLGPPIELLSRLKEVYCIATFIETGTYLGDTAYWASEVFDHVITIEAAENLYKKVIERYRHIKNIEFIYGHSREKLGDVVAGLNGTAIFWLDAHWSGGPTYGESEQCPLIDEIKVINSSEHEHFIFIDDARLFMSPPPEPHPIEQWPDIRTVISTLSSSNKARYIMIFEDVIIAVPSLAKDSVARYCQNKNTKAWKEHGIVPDDRKQTDDSKSFKKLEKRKNLISARPKRFPEVRQQSARLLRKRISQIGRCIAVNNPQAEAEWVEYRNRIRQMVLHDDPGNFLNWDTITTTMFHEAKIEELQFLQNLPDWNRWQNAIQESPVGNPRRYSAYPESSGNLVHHAYTLAQLEQKSQCRIEQLPEIVEFGGGYGSMCRLAYQMGFNGRYVIYDLPELSALQEYFLSCMGLEQFISYNNTSDVSRNIVLLSDLDKLTEQLNYKVTGCAFIASWSLSEAPVEIRDRVFNLVSGADYYLIAYQDRFGRLDNSSYFAHLTRSRTDIAWTEYPIAHLPGNHYLIGSKKSLHITNPGKAVFDTPQSSGSIGGLIFSKDRSLQLRATIESFILQCRDSDAADIVVLFKASNAVHQGEYDELKEKFPAVTFVEETDFMQQVLSVVERCKYVLFLVDDNIFVKPFSLRDVIAALDSEKNAIGFSLRLGKNTRYCYMLSSQQKLPAFESVREGILRYYWPGAECDFGYPLEVSSSVYRSNEILHLLNQLEFSNPNTLESAMSRNRNTFVSTAPVLLTFEESVTFCNSVNVVQRVYENNKFGTIHEFPAEQLADCFSRGMVIDVRKYVGFTPNSAHQEVELYFKPAERVDNGSIEISRKIHSLYERYAVGRRYGKPYISVVPLYEARGNPLVSVWMAAYNAADYIARAIESVLIQNYRNFELIIVDDGSTDRTADIVHSFKDEPIKYFFKEHGGLASTRNFQIRKSSGSFIVILDSDDMMMPDYIARHLQVFEQHPEADLVYCDDWLIDEEDKPIRIMNRPEYPDPKAFLSRLFRSGWAIVPFKNCIRKSVFDKIGLYDERLIVSEDHDMLMRFVAHGLKMRHLPAVLTLRYLTANSLSRRFNAAKAKSHFEVVRRFTETFTPEELFPDVRWDKLPAEQRSLLAKCKTAVVYLGIGEQYLGSNAPDFAEVAFEMACEQLEECCKIEPANPQVSYLLGKCRLIRATHLPSDCQPVC